MNEKVFAHGNLVNFGESVREMTVNELLNKLNRKIEESESLLMGIINLDLQELRIYGHIKQAYFDEKTGRIVFQFISADHNMKEERLLDDLFLSHEIHFDIQDRVHGLTRYDVLYITFYDEQDETTFFFADETRVSQPLDCIVEFWKQGWELGRDVDIDNLKVCTKTMFKGIVRDNAGRGKRNTKVNH